MKYSNCFIEALKAKIRDPLNVKMHILVPELNYGILHFYWTNKNLIEHYSDPNKNKTIFHRISHPLFIGVHKKSTTKAFEKLIYTRMLEQSWSKEKQIRYAKSHGFENLTPVYDI